MRYVRIFFLYFEHIYQYRSRIFVYFLISLFHPLLFLLYWRGAILGQGHIASGWVFSDIVVYYLLFIVAGAFLYIHVEEDAYEDILEGNLAMYLVRPFSYFWMKFFSELQWRIIGGTFGLIALTILFIFFQSFVHLSLEPVNILIALCVTVGGYFLMFLFKMLILLSAFWFTDTSGFREVIEIIILIFAGFVMPIPLFPVWLAHVVYASPFPYMIYYPVVAFQGKLDVYQAVTVLVVQGCWIIMFALLYRGLWKLGVKKFVGVGQ